MSSDNTHTPKSQATPSKRMKGRALLFDKLHVFYYLFLPIVAVFSMFNFMSGYLPIAFLESTLFFLGLMTYIFREKIDSYVLTQISVGYISTLFFAFVFLPTVGDSAYVWAMGLPYFISYIAGSRASIYWSTSFFIVALSLGVSLFFMGINLYWSWDIALYLMLPYVVSGIFAALFARHLEKNIDDLIQAQATIAQDIQLIEESEARYRTLLQSSMNAIAVSQHGKWAYANPACLKLFGASSFEALQGKPMMDSVHPDSWEVVKQRTKQLKQNQETLSIIEEKFLRLDGSTFIAEVSAAPILFDGKPSNFINIRDVTALKQLEHEQKEHERQLAQTQRLESLGILAGGIAHDFNNLLTVISGNAELLRMTVSKVENADKYLNHIDESCGHAADLCRQMLAYAGKGKLTMESLDLSALVASMGSLIQSSADSHVQIRMDLMGESLVAVKADVTQMKQVILNIIVNAVEAIGSKDGMIDIRTYTTYVDKQKLKVLFNGVAIEQGEYVVFAVRDTGCGISESLQEKIFDPFVTTKAEGSGLGLSAVLGVLQAHHGALRLQSQERKGTTIRVYLPILARGKPAIDILGESKALEQWVGAGLVLVVDDETMVQEVLVSFVQEMDFEVITANDGVEAVGLYEKHHRELKAVLMDVTMPKMGGLEAMFKMRDVDDTVPIVLVSGYTQREVTAEEEGERPPDAFINKPFQIESVKKILYQVTGIEP